MLALIDYIKTALSQTNSIEEALNFLPMSFKKDFLVAYIHSQTRMKDKETKAAFVKLLDEEGFTPTSLSKDELSFIKNNFPHLQQSVSYMCLKKDSKEEQKYKNKHTNDFWKKIQNVENMQAVFDISKKSNEKLCEAEFTLREVIRKRKEVHLLKGLGYIYLVESSEDISKLFEHYFGKNYICINDKYYLAYAKTLKEINMRYFVCEPK
ncbi:MAG TPA: hypothetical protein EYO73_05670 [Sulfurimonas sp.]|nr:hypothetical protein [Sulfurimonas sp.]